MCLAVPMRVVDCDAMSAHCETKGIGRTVSLLLLQHETIEPGDHVLVHVGYAIQKITADDARTTWELFDDMLAAEAAAGRDA
jgi:hydrogenase expression/formation protein HypC